MLSPPKTTRFSLLHHATVIVLCGATMAQKKPSSLEKPGALLHFRHSHERVASCRASDDGACQETRVQAPAATDLTLNPIADPLVTEPTPARSLVQVSLPSGTGNSSAEVRVGVGTWQLAWGSERSAFHVYAGREFPVLLTTVSGQCIHQTGTCAVQSSVTRRSVSIPPEFAASE